MKKRRTYNRRRSLSCSLAHDVDGTMMLKLRLEAFEELDTYSEA